jgi:hypothetical protein
MREKLMKKFFLVCGFAVVLLALWGCVTLPGSTGYVPARDISDYGYYIKSLNSGIYAVIYRGNSATPVDVAYAYTILAGYDQCINLRKVGLVAKPENLTKEETHTNVSSYNTANYHLDGSVSYTPQVYSYDSTYVYPRFLTTCSCQDRFKEFAHAPTFEAIKAELVHDVTKDFHGGLLAKSVGGSDKGKPFLVDDVLIRINSDRVEELVDIQKSLQKVTADKVNISIIRNQKIIKLSASITDFTESVKKLQDATVAFLCKKIPVEDRENMANLCPPAPTDHQ